ncbi:hypothetical protein AVEN_147940-1 [Araneus ventricosus]|uniref:Uncharacterized protein n=1 Tax=Araneus ventricosus TaxID=182803 RepID=A0A4Y2HGH9_ARAVE|nr:hypothetical protein AVEN_50372-1 [Araneus ventricosus]GBM64369.1 hypothetical protein AVEN_147940-1 [Araneus ventricosus]
MEALVRHHSLPCLSSVVLPFIFCGICLPAASVFERRIFRAATCNFSDALTRRTTRKVTRRCVEVHFRHYTYLDRLRRHTLPTLLLRKDGRNFVIS